MARPTHKPEYEEGPQAAQNFTDAMRNILKVSPKEISRRIEAEKKPSSPGPAEQG